MWSCLLASDHANFWFWSSVMMTLKLQQPLCSGNYISLNLRLHLSVPAHTCTFLVCLDGYFYHKWRDVMHWSALPRLLFSLEHYWKVLQKWFQDSKKPNAENMARILSAKNFRLSMRTDSHDVCMVTMSFMKVSRLMKTCLLILKVHKRSFRNIFVWRPSFQTHGTYTTFSGELGVCG